MSEINDDMWEQIELNNYGKGKLVSIVNAQSNLIQTQQAELASLRGELEEAKYQSNHNFNLMLEYRIAILSLGIDFFRDDAGILLGSVEMGGRLRGLFGKLAKERDAAHAELEEERKSCNEAHIRAGNRWEEYEAERQDHNYTKKQLASMESTWTPPNILLERLTEARERARAAGRREAVERCVEVEGKVYNSGDYQWVETRILPEGYEFDIATPVTVWVKRRTE